MTAPRKVDASELREGDLVRVSFDESAVVGRLKANGWFEGVDINPAMRQERGWLVELLDRPVPTPAPGLYVWRHMLGEDGLIPEGARVVKWKGYWTNAQGGSGGTHDVERAWEAGKLVGPLRFQE